MLYTLKVGTILGVILGLVIVVGLLKIAGVL